MSKRIAVLPGDGIGPEITKEAARVLRCSVVDFDQHFELVDGLIGGSAWDVYGEHLPNMTLQICRSADAILFGAIGGPIAEAQSPKWKNCEVNALLGIRKAFKFNANIRPVQVNAGLTSISPLREIVLSGGVDLVIFRELSSDIYFGEHRRFEIAGVRHATDIAEYNETTVRNIAIKAFEAARTRKKKLVSVDKANVLDTSRLWREVVKEVAIAYSDVHYEDMLVDNCAMQLVARPTQFDVILTSNLFGDILSDIAGAIPGSLGMLASASLNDNGFGLYEPPSGSAPDIAGKGIANPIGQILSAAMLLRYSFKMEREAANIERAVRIALTQGARTRDIASPGDAALSTSGMADAVIANLEAHRI